MRYFDAEYSVATSALPKSFSHDTMVMILHSNIRLIVRVRSTDIKNSSTLKSESSWIRVPHKVSNYKSLKSKETSSNIAVEVHVIHRRGCNYVRDRVRKKKKGKKIHRQLRNCRRGGFAINGTGRVYASVRRAERAYIFLAARSEGEVARVSQIIARLIANNRHRCVCITTRTAVP